MRMSALYKFLILPLPSMVSIFQIERVRCVLEVFLACKGSMMIENRVEAHKIAHSLVTYLQQIIPLFNMDDPR